MQSTALKQKNSIYSNWVYLVNRIFYGKTYKEKLLFLAQSGLSAVMAAVFFSTTLPFTEFSVGRPLLDAFLCSVGGSAIGAFAGCFYALYKGNVSIPIYIAYGLIFILRIALSRSYSSMDSRRPPFSEGILSKLTASAILCFTLSGLYLAENGFAADTASRLLATMTCTPALTIIFAVFFDGCPVARIGSAGADLHRIFYELCTYAVFALSVYTFKNVYYMGVSVGVLFALFLTFVTAKRGGFLRGTVLGALLGMTASPFYAAPMALLGFVSALLFPLGPLAACGAACAASVALSSYLNGLDTFISYLPVAVMATAITSPVIRYSFLPKRFPFPSDASTDPLAPLTSATEDGLRKAEEFRAIKELSEGLREISGELGSFDKTEAENRAVCEKIHVELCEKCPLNPICWEHERTSTESDLISLASRYKRAEDGKISTATSYLSDHCIKYKELTSKLNAFCRGTIKPKAKHISASARNEYGMISALLTNFTEHNRSELIRHFDTEATLSRKLRAFGFTSFEVTVYGEKRTRISLFGPDLSTSPETAEKLRGVFSELCGKQFMSPVFEKADYPCAVFTEAEKFTSEISVASICKEGESLSGDTASSFYDENGHLYALISDGMGSGKTANECSKMTSSLLAKLMKLNIDHNMAIDMLGDIIKARFKECFATVDLCELDLVRGNAKFVKSGAADSYIVRNGSVYCVNAQSMPVGITGETSPAELLFSVMPGDVIVMVSDGVAEDKSDGKWIIELLSMLKYESAGELSELILNTAVKEKGRIADDMTVLALQIQDANADEQQETAVAE